MNDYNFMLKNGVVCSTTALAKPIKDTAINLAKKVESLNP
jgi:hypothetical protein